MKTSVHIFINGERHDVRPGISVAAALLADGRDYQFRRTSKGGDPRGLFCGMGVCFDCLVTIDDRHEVRACMTAVSDGMRIIKS